MSVLILGGAGYIGSHTALELVRSGEDVVVGDIRDFDFLDNLFYKEKIDAVIHFEAFSLVGGSVTAPLKYYDNNLYGTKVLLEGLMGAIVD